MSNPTRCRSCNVPIRFERTVTGKLTPVEIHTGEAHWTNCPQRREWRKSDAQPSLFDDAESSAQHQE